MTLQVTKTQEAWDLLLSHKDNVKLANPPQQIFQICPTH